MAACNSQSGVSSVLKVTCKDEIHRLMLEGEPSFEGVNALLQSLWKGTDIPIAKYTDEDGDSCTLVEATFTDFMTTAKPSFEEALQSGARPVLKVSLVQPLTEQAASSVSSPKCTVPAEMGLGPLRFPLEGLQHFLPSMMRNWPATANAEAKTSDDVEARAMVESTRVACEDELSRHLAGWLAASPSEVSFEAWIAAVHPENAANHGEVDVRMYLEASTHRQIWNQKVCSGIDDAERVRRFVPSMEDKAAAAQAGTASVAEDFPQPSAPPLVAPVTLGNAEDYSAAWIEASVPIIAGALPVTALSLIAQRHLINGVMPDVADDAKQGFRLLADALGESGNDYQALATIANGLATGVVRQGDGLADLTAAAARLSWAGRCFYARAICVCCPKVLMHVLPPFLLAPGLATAAAATATAVSLSPDEIPSGPALRRGLTRQAVLLRAMQRQACRQAREAHQEVVRQAGETQQQAVRQAREAQQQATNQGWAFQHQAMAQARDFQREVADAHQQARRYARSFSANWS